MGADKRNAPCECDETVGFDHAAGTATCRKCGHTRLVRTGFHAHAEPAPSLIAEAMLADAVRTDAPRTGALPTDSAERKRRPMCSGLLDYFPAALAEVSRVSHYGNEKHNPGQPLHHARGKSMDHADCIVRHLAERGGFDGEMRHSACLAWRALALLQEELEAEGAPLARGARLPEAGE